MKKVSICFAGIYFQSFRGTERSFIVRWNRLVKCRVRAAMTEEAEGRYFATSEESERTMSRIAYDWRVAAAHAELADRYEALAAVFGAKRLKDVPIDYL